MELHEEWRPVVGYEGMYEVSDQGRVRSLTRRVTSGPGRTRIACGRVLSTYDGGKYSKVRLKSGDGGRTMNVHQLVARAFHGEPAPGHEVCHNNGQHHDNRASNLRYDTHSANQRDTVRLGGHVNANKTHCKNGHEFTPENTRLRANGEHRACKACESWAWRRRAA